MSEAWHVAMADLHFVSITHEKLANQLVRRRDAILVQNFLRGSPNACMLIRGYNTQPMNSAKRTGTSGKVGIQRVVLKVSRDCTLCLGH